MGATFTVWRTSVVNDTCDMVHFTHTDDIGGEEVETVLVASFLAEFELGAGVFSCDGGDGSEEEMGSVGHPIDPSVIRYVIGGKYSNSRRSGLPQ